MPHIIMKIVGGYCFTSGLVSTLTTSLAARAAVGPTVPTIFGQLLHWPMVPIVLSGVGLVALGAVLFLNPSLPFELIK